MIAASTHRFSINLVNAAASSTYTRMLLNCERNRANGPLFLPSGKRFGPYLKGPRRGLGWIETFSELVASRFTTLTC